MFDNQLTNVFPLLNLSLSLSLSHSLSSSSLCLNLSLKNSLSFSLAYTNPHTPWYTIILYTISISPYHSHIGTHMCSFIEALSLFLIYIVHQPTLSLSLSLSLSYTHFYRGKIVNHNSTCSQFNILIDTHEKTLFLSLALVFLLLFYHFPSFHLFQFSKNLFFPSQQLFFI